MRHHLTLDLLPGRFAAARLDPEAAVPEWAETSPLMSVTRTASELSVICAESAVPPTSRAQRGLRCLAVRGPLDFVAVGVLESLARPLAEADISVLALSTYDTDYLFVADEHLDAAVRALTGAGFSIHGVTR